ncbi:hypothetical protein, partial [Plasmodium yoelii yoelii]
MFFIIYITIYTLNLFSFFLSLFINCILITCIYAHKF